jgi:ABC-type antimicrobial peptide transport system permease subunit
MLRVALILIGIALVALSLFFFTRLDFIVHGDLYKFGLQLNSEWAENYWTLSTYFYYSLRTAMVMIAGSTVFIFIQTRTQINLSRAIICTPLIIGTFITGFAAGLFNQLDLFVHTELYRYGLQFSYEWAGQYWTYTGLILGLLGMAIIINSVITVSMLFNTELKLAYASARNIPRRKLRNFLLFFTITLSIVFAIVIYLVGFDPDSTALVFNFFSMVFQSFANFAAAPVLNLLIVFGIAIPTGIAAGITASAIILVALLFVQSSFTKIAIKNVPKRVLRNCITVLAIVLGVSLVVGVNISFDSSLVEFNRSINQAAGNVDISIRSALNEPFNQSLLETISETNDVANASQRVSDRVEIWEPVEEEWVIATMVGVNSSSDFGYLSSDDMREIGQLEVNGTDVIVDEGLNFTIGDIMKGKTITYNFSDPLFEQSNSSEEIEFNVVGIYYPEQLGAGQGSSHTVFIDLVKAQHVFDREGKTDYVIVEVTDIEYTNHVVKDLEDELGIAYVITPVKENILSSIGQASMGFQSGLQIMSVLTVCVAVVLILNTIYLNVNERTFEIGILRAVGSSKKQIFWMFFSESITLGIIGVTIGLFLGIPFAQAFSFLSSQFSSALMPAAESFVFKPWHFILGAIIGISATAIGGLFPSIFASRINIINALRPLIRKSGKPRTTLKLIGAGIPISVCSVFIFNLMNNHSGPAGYSTIFVWVTIVPLLMVGLIASTAGLLRGLSPIFERILILFGGSRRIISRNIGRNLMRSTICFTLIGMTLSFIIVVAGAQGGVKTGLEDVINSFYSADLTITSENLLNKTFATDLALTDTGELITNVAPTLIVPRIVNLLNNQSDTNSSSMVIAIDSEYSKVMSMKFSDDTPEDVFLKLKSNGTIILTDPLAKSLNVTVNDEIQMPILSLIQVPTTIPDPNVTIPDDWDGTIPDDWDGTIPDDWDGTIPDDWDGTIPTITINITQLEITNVNFTVIGIAVGSMLEWNHGIYSSSLSEASYISYESLNETFPEFNETANLFFTKINPEQEVNLVRDRVKEVYGSEYQLNTLTTEDTLNPAREGIDKTFAILNGVVMFAVVNAAIGVAALMVMNISERRREIGILRSLGMSRLQVVASTVGEAVVLAGAGAAVGIIAGLILNQVTIGFMQTMGFPIPFAIPFDSIWLSLLLATVASLISAAYPAYRASRLKIVDSLRR